LNESRALVNSFVCGLIVSASQFNSRCFFLAAARTPDTCRAARKTRETWNRNFVAFFSFSLSLGNFRFLQKREEAVNVLWRRSKVTHDYYGQSFLLGFLVSDPRAAFSGNFFVLRSMNQAANQSRFTSTRFSRRFRLHKTLVHDFASSFTGFTAMCALDLGSFPGNDDGRRDNETGSFAARIIVSFNPATAATAVMHSNDIECRQTWKAFVVDSNHVRAAAELRRDVMWFGRACDLFAINVC
jgi:hypothetical protein